MVGANDFCGMLLLQSRNIGGAKCYVFHITRNIGGAIAPRLPMALLSNA